MNTNAAVYSENKVKCKCTNRNNVNVLNVTNNCQTFKTFSITLLPKSQLNFTYIFTLLILTG